MARSSRGNKLQSLTLQPGSEFTTTEKGFDTGSRTVVCDESVAVKLEPSIGAADSEIEYFTSSGKKLGVHPWMFVTGVSVTNDALGQVKMRIDFRGRKLAIGQRIGIFKRPFYEHAMEAFQFQVGDSNINIPLPVVAKTYVTADIVNLDPINSLVTPPPFISVLADLVDLASGLPLPTPQFNGWQLTGRVLRAAGVEGRRRIWEITETIAQRVLF